MSDFRWVIFSRTTSGVLYIRALLVLALVLLASPAVSEQGIPDAVTRVVTKLIPGLEPDRVHSTPIPNLYLASFGAELVYISVDGRYLLTGDLIELDSGRNLSEEARSEARKAIIDALGESGMVVFSPKKIRND